MCIYIYVYICIYIYIYIFIYVYTVAAYITNVLNNKTPEYRNSFFLDEFYLLFWNQNNEIIFVILVSIQKISQNIQNIIKCFITLTNKGFCDLFNSLLGICWQASAVLIRISMCVWVEHKITSNVVYFEESCSKTYRWDI